MIECKYIEWLLLRKCWSLGWFYEDLKDYDLIDIQKACFSIISESFSHVCPCFRYGHACVCVFVHIELKWPQDLLLLIILWWHVADDQLKILGQIPNQSCALRVFHTTVCRCFFTALFPFRSFLHTERQGSFHHTWTHTHMNTCKKHMHTRTHKWSTAYYSLLICRALIETPLSPSHTCIPSLIISQGAFGGRREGGWWRKDRTPESPVTGQLYIHRSDWIKLSSQLVFAFSSIGGKKDAWSKTCGYVFSTGLGW